MIKERLNGHDVEFYDSIEDLPIVQFHRYGKYALIDSGVGDNLQDIDRHITKVANSLNDSKTAYNELLNLRQCLYMVVNEVDVHNKSTLCLVKSVDGEDWKDYSESGLDALYFLLNGTRNGEIEEVAKRLKAKLDMELGLYFPRIFQDAREKNYLDLLRRRALLQVGEIVDGADNKEKIAKIEEQIASMQTPHIFSGSESEEIKFDKQFEDMCLVMAKEFGGGVKKYTTMEFYSAFEMLSKEQEEIKKAKKKK